MVQVEQEKVEAQLLLQLIYSKEAQRVAKALQKSN
jgi:hypothetical protein